MGGNEALDVNQGVAQHANLNITTRGSDWLFTVCAIMGVSTLIFMGLAMTKPRTHRLFHYITAGITAVACIAYWSMGSGLGQTPIQAEFVRPGSSKVFAAGTREIFYVRYIDWFVTTPLLLTDLLLTAGLPWPTILITILADEIMIVCGLVGALTKTSYKWGYWVFGMFAFFFVIYELVFDGRRHANALGGSVKRTFLHCGVLTIFLWFLYPIAWGLAEGGNVIHPDSEAIFYGILDILAKPVFGMLLVFGHNTIDPLQLGLAIREPGGHVHAGEKSHFDHAGPAVAANNGATNHGSINNGVTNNGIGHNGITHNGNTNNGTTGYGPTSYGTADHGTTGHGTTGHRVDDVVTEPVTTTQGTTAHGTTGHI
ncbi:hypothetical protein VSDG_09386 [Cytospora chrysosperma]|uniref:Uncharacterized protein n=1 Tax=Cytospora chrysosperma TaxID=252740 RepID=A0A423VB86_CYTCH|nr:hypothetical protein VSDG_09386 [Valsa sordida]